MKIFGIVEDSGWALEKVKAEGEEDDEEEDGAGRWREPGCKGLLAGCPGCGDCPRPSIKAGLPNAMCIAGLRGCALQRWVDHAFMCCPGRDWAWAFNPGPHRACSDGETCCVLPVWCGLVCCREGAADGCRHVRGATALRLGSEVLAQNDYHSRGGQGYTTYYTSCAAAHVLFDHFHMSQALNDEAVGSGDLKHVVHFHGGCWGLQVWHHRAMPPWTQELQLPHALSARRP